MQISSNPSCSAVTRCRQSLARRNHAFRKREIQLARRAKDEAADRQPTPIFERVISAELARRGFGQRRRVAKNHCSPLTASRSSSTSSDSGPSRISLMYSGKEHSLGLSRSRLYELIAQGSVQSICLKSRTFCRLSSFEQKGTVLELSQAVGTLLNKNSNT